MLEFVGRHYDVMVAGAMILFATTLFAISLHDTLRTLRKFDKQERR